MKGQLPKLCAAVGATVLLVGCVPDTVNVQVSTPPQEEGPPEATAVSVPPGPPGCMKPLTVAANSTDAHLKSKQKFRVVGPSAVGDYEFRPLPSTMAPPHSVLAGDYLLLVLSSSGLDYVTEVQVMGDTHGMVTPHIYDVVMKLGPNGCPSELTFKGQPHVTPVTGDNDHAGHAVLN
jgi:hypothetical protein